MNMKLATKTTFDPEGVPVYYLSSIPHDKQLEAGYTRITTQYEYEVAFAVYEEGVS